MRSGRYGKAVDAQNNQREEGRLETNFSTIDQERKCAFHNMEVK